MAYHVISKLVSGKEGAEWTWLAPSETKAQQGLVKPRRNPNGADVFGLYHWYTKKLMAKGTVEEINAWAAKKGLKFKPDASNRFGGYYIDSERKNYIADDLAEDVVTV